MSVELPQIPWTSPASEISGTFLDRSNRSPAGVFDISSDSDSLPVIMAATSAAIVMRSSPLEAATWRRTSNPGQLSTCRDSPSCCRRMGRQIR